MNTSQAVVGVENDGTRVWKYVFCQWKDIVKSKEQMRRCFKRGEVAVNGVAAEVTRILATGDVVQINFDSLAAHESIYGREKLDVRYEDDYLAVIVKPAGKTMVAFGYMLPFSLRPTGSAEYTEGQIQSTGALETATEEQGDEDEVESFVALSNISPTPTPTPGQQHRLPCAVHLLEKASNGLVLVAKTLDMRSTLIQMHNERMIRRTFRVICHGAWAPGPSTHSDDSLDAVYPAVLDVECIGAIQVVSITPSNEATSISTLDISPHSPYMGVNVRRYFMSIQHPVVGDSGNTKPLKANRKKGLMSALVKVEFVHPRLGTPVVICLDEPAKFEQLRIREQRASLRRQENDMEELKKGGLDPISTYDRTTNQPIAYMVGEKDFFGMRFKVSPSTLIPRSSTETLVHAAIDVAQGRSVKILDVGTGCGCLLLSLLNSIPSATGVGVDISQEALEVAKVNSALHSLEHRARFQVGDLGSLETRPEFLRSFDVLVCNPPYLDSSKAAKLTKTFACTEYEPPVALFASNEGYAAYELLAASLLRDLRGQGPRYVMGKGAHIILEIGSGMGQRVRDIFKFLSFECALKDKQGSERCLVFAVTEPCADVVSK
ncbi:hypothetical protein BGZ65_006905 [Modicella reniformis]|uniref:Methyltransferase domain-containing protein n=1 Tax=Modicella reniformis TaxID=1440133 RepID=A0A9P6J7C4_9FUNG|nr:hypothetical protein BGZ65_006905 [Modicella reniformis]